MKYLLCFIVVVLTACNTTPKNPEYWMEQEINACLPTAIIFKQSLNKYGVWSKVFSYTWLDQETYKLRGHAMVAYLYPPGKNMLWTYDNQGSFRVRAYTNNVMNIAQEAHKVRGGKEKLTSYMWLD